jgi:hypothetical protein
MMIRYVVPKMAFDFLIGQPSRKQLNWKPSGGEDGPRVEFGPDALRSEDPQFESRQGCKVFEET